MHAFTLTGELMDRVEPPKRDTGRRVQVVIDLPLRMLLISKGLIIAEELLLKEAELRDQFSQARRDAANNAVAGDSSGIAEDNGT
jgi:hypothetical protein